MANEIRDAKDGLGTLLAGISGLKVLDYPPAALHEFPAAVLLFESRDARQTLGGSSFAGKIKVVLLVSSANTQQAYDSLDGYMDPLGAFLDSTVRCRRAKPTPHVLHFSTHLSPLHERGRPEALLTKVDYGDNNSCYTP